MMETIDAQAPLTEETIQFFNEIYKTREPIPMERVHKMLNGSRRRKARVLEQLVGLGMIQTRKTLLGYFLIPVGDN